MRCPEFSSGEIIRYTVINIHHRSRRVQKDRLPAPWFRINKQGRSRGGGGGWDGYCSSFRSNRFLTRFSERRSSSVPEILIREG
jgi:hypothetical protein